MAISPVYESQANDNVEELYKRIKKSLDLPHLPLFFAYLGAFPEYLQYLTDQITNLAQDKEFKDLCLGLGKNIGQNFDEYLSYSPELQKWIEQYKYVPAFYNLRKDLQYIFLNNIKIAFIFIALREAIKGWAVAAKKLPTEINTEIPIKSREKAEEEFVFDDIYLTNPDSEDKQIQEYPWKQNNKAIIHAGKSALEKDLLPEYLLLCRRDFNEVIKEESFLRLRVKIEEDILNKLDILPSSIHSPINVVLQYTSKYPDFPDLLYLLSEYFPTYAVQRMLFSGYMIKKY